MYIWSQVVPQLIKRDGELACSNIYFSIVIVLCPIVKMLKSGYIGQRCNRLVAHTVLSVSEPTEEPLSLCLCQSIYAGPAPSCSLSAFCFIALWQASKLDGMPQLKKILTFFGWCLNFSISSSRKMAMLGAGWPRSPKPSMTPSTCSASSSLSRAALQPSFGETKVT